LAHQVLRAARDRGPDRHLVIRLTPPELGTVRIEFHHEGTALQVVLQAEDPAVRRALEQAIPHLRQELSRHEGSTIAVTVGSQADHPAGQGERNPQDRSQGRDQGSPGSRRGPRFDLERLASLGPAVATRSGGVGLARVDTQA
jgi:flagellar hook-length control protein FliK